MALQRFLLKFPTISNLRSITKRLAVFIKAATKTVLYDHGEQLRDFLHVRVFIYNTKLENLFNFHIIHQMLGQA